MYLAFKGHGCQESIYWNNGHKSMCVSMRKWFVVHFYSGICLSKVLMRKCLWQHKYCWRMRDLLFYLKMYQQIQRAKLMINCSSTTREEVMDDWLHKESGCCHSAITFSPVFPPLTIVIISALSPVNLAGHKTWSRFLNEEVRVVVLKARVFHFSSVFMWENHIKQNINHSRDILYSLKHVMRETLTSVK